MTDVNQMFQNLFEVIEKNKEKFTLNDCHNFVSHINNLKKIVDAKNNDFANLAAKYNAVVDKLNEIDGKIDQLSEKLNKPSNEI